MRFGYCVLRQLYIGTFIYLIGLNRSAGSSSDSK